MDNLLVQIGTCSLLLPDHMEARGHSEGKKLRELLLGRAEDTVRVSYCKKSLFKKTAGEATALLTKVVGVDTHNTNSAEVSVLTWHSNSFVLFLMMLAPCCVRRVGHQVERPLACSCLEALAQHTDLLRDTDAFGTYSLSFGSLRAFMRLDSAAAAAINLFPRADDPSALGSLSGVLGSHCKTKMGTRLLDRWLRQPLLDVNALNHRLDMVQLLKGSAAARNQLADTALKGT